MIFKKIYILSIDLERKNWGSKNNASHPRFVQNSRSARYNVAIQSSVSSERIILKRKERKQLTNDERVEMTMRLDRRKLEQSGTISMCTCGNSQAVRNRSLGGKGRNKEREGRISVEWL